MLCMLSDQKNASTKILDCLSFYLAKLYSCAKFHCHMSIWLSKGDKKWENLALGSDRGLHFIIYSTLTDNPYTIKKSLPLLCMVDELVIKI